MAKPINILHSIPKLLNAQIVVLPCGLYCNTALQKARSGDLVEFWQEWRHEKRRIVQITKFRINMPEFTFMLRCVYGERMTIAKLFEQWEAWAVVESIGSTGFSKDEALVVEVENINED